jgi:hypothetical protein
MELKRDSKSVIVDNLNRDIIKLFCTCGFTGKLKERKRGAYKCPKCKKEPEVNLLNKKYVKFTNLMKIEKDHEVNMTYTVFMYRDSNRDDGCWWNQELDEIDYKFSKKIFKINLSKTKWEVLLQRGNTVQELTSANYWYSDIQSSLLKEFQDDEINQNEIIETLLKARGIKYLDRKRVTGSLFYKISDYLKCPNLELLEMDAVKVPVDPKTLEVINNATSKIELISSLTGHKSKRIREKAETTENLNFLMMWGSYINEPENVINFMEQIDIKGYYTTLFDYALADEAFEYGIQLIKDLHKNKNEKIWLNRLVKAVKRGQDVTINPYSIASYVHDIGRMHKMIKEKNENYQINFNGDIGNLHDTLALDQRKMDSANRVINYDETEKKWEKKINENKKFILAPDTHYLIEVGALMNICVGSYHDYATSKYCSIVVLKENEKPVVCIEVRQNRLMQAKMKRNNRPTDEYRDDVIAWCKENEIKYQDCYDIA